MLVLKFSFPGLHLEPPNIDGGGGATISTVMTPILEPCMHDAAAIINSRILSTIHAGIQAVKKVKIKMEHVSVHKTIKL
jgi:hypothetical protein